MKRPIVWLLVALLASMAPVRGQQTVLNEISWQQLADSGQLKHGTVVTLPDKSVALKVENPGPEPLQVTLVTIEQPKITSEFYRVLGDVQYENVMGDGFLEMWNHFEDGGAYFSRTLGDVGPMAKIRGTSDWRPFILPFNAKGTKSRPNKLVINLHLPGKGVVYLRDLKLVQPSENGAGVTPAGALRNPGAWWSDRSAGLLGGIGGALIGCLGSFMEFRAKRGKSRGFVIGACRALIGIGAVSAGLGFVAILSQQPYSVWYVLLLLGVLLVLIFPFRLRRYQELYRQMELRRMASMDAA